MTRALALVTKPLGMAPSQRFRLEQWAPLLRSQHGIAIDFLPFESPGLAEVLYQPGKMATKARLVVRDAIRRREVLALAANYDVVIIHRQVSLIGPAIYERLLVRSGTPIIFDFDDAIWLPSRGSASGIFSQLRFGGKTSTICRLAAAVVTGNQYLADYAKRFSEHVHIVPSTVDLGSSPLQTALSYDIPFTVVWAGSLFSLPYLDVVRKALDAIGRSRQTVLRIICSHPPERPFNGVQVEFVPWTVEGEAAKLAHSHAGIMPLTDTELSRGKCGLKALQYMAVGRPVVLSPVGFNREIVRDGENGLFASTDREWVRALEALAESRELRDRLGRAGRRTVEEQFSTAVGAAAFAQVVNDVVNHSRRRAARVG